MIATPSTRSRDSLVDFHTGFEDSEGLNRTRGLGSGLDNGDEARDRAYQKQLEEEERARKEAEERKARLERARQRRDEARRKKHQDERAARVRANKDEVDRVEARRALQRGEMLGHVVTLLDAEHAVLQRVLGSSQSVMVTRRPSSGEGSPTPLPES